MRVTNTGRTNAEDVAIMVPLPQEFRGMEIIGGSAQLAVDGTQDAEPADWEGIIDTLHHRAILKIPVLTAGKTAQFDILYPRIDQQGYDITCVVFVGGQEVARETERIVPLTHLDSVPNAR